MMTLVPNAIKVSFGNSALRKVESKSESIEGGIVVVVAFVNTPSSKRSLQIRAMTARISTPSVEVAHCKSHQP